MGFGSSRKRRDIYFCGLRAVNGEKQTDPHFSVTYKKDGVQMNRTETEISGRLYRLAVGGYDYQGAQQRTIIVELVDGKDLIKLEANIESQLTRNIVNCIVGRESKGYDGVVFLRTYIRTKDDKKYAAVFVGGEDAKNDAWNWKWTPEDVKPLLVRFYNPKNKKAGQTPGEPNDTDYSALNDLMLEHFEELGKRINGQLALMNKLDEDDGEEEVQKGASQSTNAPVPNTAEESPVVDNSPSDDLPF